MTLSQANTRRAAASRFSLAAALFLATAGAASAMPLAATPAVSTGADQAQIIEVRGGCGFGEHRGPLGGCRLNNGPRGAIRASRTGFPRGCPPGMRRGIYGRCHF